MEQKNRKTATKLRIINWARFQNVTVRLEGSTLLTGINTSGKSTILDAMMYLLTGNTQFNKAAKDRDRTVTSYVRGDTKSNGPERYLRKGPVVSYLAMEFYSPVEDMYLVVAVGMESMTESESSSSWFVCRDTRLEDIDFCRIEEKKLYVSPLRQLKVKGQPLKGSDLMGRDRGTEQVMRTLGLRCDRKKYRTKLLKMMAFNPENNIDQFISECVLEPGTIDSLKELREQKEHFEKLRESYRELQEGKEKLLEIEQKTQIFEKKSEQLGIRELMLLYQEVKGKEEELAGQEAAEQEQEQRLRSLKRQEEELASQLEFARERLKNAETNETYLNMRSSIQTMEQHLLELKPQITEYEKETVRLGKLQGSLGGELAWLVEEAFPNGEGQAVFQTLMDEKAPQEKAGTLFSQLCVFAGETKGLLQDERVHAKDEERDLTKELSQLAEQLSRLSSNRLLEPEPVTQAKTRITKALAKRGIDTEVRTFAELVQDLKNEDWRMAIETFLGRKRYHLIIEAKYCQQAMEILHEEHLPAAVVMTDRLADTPISEGSAAQQLIIPNGYARRYANFLLNGMYLCEDLGELHEHPLGGLMRDGTLARGYAVSVMNLKETRVCLGSRAVELQKKEVQKRQEEVKDLLGAVRKRKETAEEKLRQLDLVDWKADVYQFSAPRQLSLLRQEWQETQESIRRIKENPDFFTVLQEQQDAKRCYDEAVSRSKSNSSEIRFCEARIEESRTQQKQLSAEIYLAQNQYEEERLRHMEWERPMLEEYEKLRKRTGVTRVIRERTVKALVSEVEESRQAMENAQLDYCRIAQIDLYQRGPAYIPFYRDQYRSIANVKIEQVRGQLEEQSRRLESAFMNDFVAEINETVIEAKAEIEAINRELKQLPFGKDTYRFIMKEKADRAVFFRICRRLKDYMDSPEAYMSSMRDDEEMEHDIQEFMSVILDEEDETEYTDYRKYFSYDMEIVSNQGGSRVTADLSRKQGSASGGEKQTPYFIILAASLMQCYPRQTCCARLAFIDEAFSALSRERIEQMVNYLETNGFQVIYAAPPEKIGSIGQFIDCTVSLVMTGRYTNVVEGLIRQEDL